MNIEMIEEIVTKYFSEKYVSFKDFQNNQIYKPLWDICINTLRNCSSMEIMVFCNDTYNFPPVRVFVDLNREMLDDLKKNDVKHLFFNVEGEMNMVCRQNIGAFWGMVFRFGIGYGERRTATLVGEKYYGIITASRFIDKDEKYILGG